MVGHPHLAGAVLVGRVDLRITLTFGYKRNLRRRRNGSDFADRVTRGWEWRGHNRHDAIFVAGGERQYHDSRQMHEPDHGRPPADPFRDTIMDHTGNGPISSSRTLIDPATPRESITQLLHAAQ